MSQATASWPALGSTASVVVTDGEYLAPARAAVEDELASIDAACSRFRADSEISKLNRAGGRAVEVSPLLFGAIRCALDAAHTTGGTVDPTVGAAMDAIGYDRDFDAIATDGPPIAPAAVPGWRAVHLDRGSGTAQLAEGVQLDLGATAKAWAADLAAARAGAVTPAGVSVLVSLGGDIAVAGAPPGGWPVAIADNHADATGTVTIAISSGGIATSSTTVRHWRRDGQPVHHIVDPETGLPASTPWRTVTVAATSCVDANAASTAAIVRGHDAPRWLEAAGLPARLVAHDGGVLTLAGWPAEREAA